MYPLKLSYCLHMKTDWVIDYHTLLPSTSLAPCFNDSCPLTTGETGNKCKELRSCTIWN